jgi:hypothetical protein
MPFPLNHRGGVMGKPTIAVLGAKTNKQCQAFAEAVDVEGGRPVVLDMRLGRGAAGEVSLGNGVAIWDGVDCMAIDAYYLRGTAPNTWPSLPPVMNATSFAEYRMGYDREQECQAFGYSFFDWLDSQGKLVVNPPSRFTHHNSKAQFYERLRAHGFAVPPTVTTNDHRRFSEFISKRGKVVVKPGIGVGSTRLLHDFQIDRVEELALCPVMMQECIPGNTMRIHVVANTMVLALKVLGDQIDSRTQPKGFEYAELPGKATADVVEATRLLGLHFAAWDAILASDGRAVLLDCNPGPYMMWIGQKNVHAVFRCLAGFLIRFTQCGSKEEAAKYVVSCESQS